jgi:hypothetical protein
MGFHVWVTFRAASQAEAHSRAAGPRRVFCAVRMFEFSAAEFEELWPGLEREPGVLCQEDAKSVMLRGKMRVGRSESPCRGRLRTARSCFSQKLRW